MESHVSIEDTIHNIELRRESENIRYQQYYGINIYDMNLYDFVLDTTGRPIEEVLALTIAAIEKYQSNV